MVYIFGFGCSRFVNNYVNLKKKKTKTEICVRIFVSCVYYLCVLFAFRDLHFGKDHILHSGRKMFDDFDARGERGKTLYFVS